MKISLVRIQMLVLCVTLLHTPPVFGQASVSHGQAHSNVTPLPPATQKLHDPEYWTEQKKEAEALSNDAWLHENWTGDDAPYAALRGQIDHGFNTMHPKALVAEYAPAAKSRPNDPLAQFAWAYAVHKAITSSRYPIQDADNTRSAAELALAEAPFPRTYNFARLRVLITLQSPVGGGYHTLIGTARHLLQKNPNDFPVTMGLIAMDSQNSDRSAQKEGYALIRKAIRQQPDNPQVYDMLGGWYHAQYILYHKPNDYESAINNYQRAMNMYPMTASRRANIPQIMDFLTRRYHQITGS